MHDELDITDHEQPKSGTCIWGCSDDLIESRGDVDGEICCSGTDDREKGVLLICSDGTLLEVKYGKSGIWGISLIQKGRLFSRVETCTDENGLYSDLAVFGKGLKWILAAKEWDAEENTHKKISLRSWRICGHVEAA